MWLGNAYTEHELLSRVGARDKTFIFQTHCPTDREGDAEGDGRKQKVVPITKSSFGTARGPIFVYVSMQSRTANMHATNVNCKNEGVRVIDLECGTTNKQVHQLIRGGLQKFFRADVTAAATAAVPTTPYDLKYENVGTHCTLPNDDDEFTADKLYVQVDPRAFDLAEFSQTAFNLDASMSSSCESGVIPLKSCLQRFSVEKQIDKVNEKWHCHGCKKRVQVFKSIELCRLPTILIIQLKRFVYEETSCYGQRSTIRNKINNLVDFPITGLDLSDIATGPQDPIYDLFAILNHHGGLFL